MVDTNRDTSEWVRDRFAELARDSAWQPNPDVGLVHLKSYTLMAKRRRRFQRAAALVVLSVGALALAAPTTRGIARQMLDRFYMRNPEAIRSSLPEMGQPLFKVEVTRQPTLGRPLLSLADAQHEAGFDPRLPPTLAEEVISGLAVVSVAGPFDARQKINVNDLRAALQKRGIEGVRVPQNWDGVETGFHMGPSVVVVFLDGWFVQSLPPAILTPPDFPMIDFTEIALRISGVSPSEAHTSRAMFVESGGAFAIVPPDAKSSFREVSLKSGRALLFENDTDQDEHLKCSFFCPGPHQRVLTWAALGRLFQLRSGTLTAEQMLDFANSING